jgi:hypothetical protein
MRIVENAWVIARVAGSLPTGCRLSDVQICPRREPETQRGGYHRST